MVLFDPSRSGVVGSANDVPNQAVQPVRAVAEAWGASKGRIDRMLVNALAELRERLEDESA